MKNPGLRTRNKHAYLFWGVFFLTLLSLQASAIVPYRNTTISGITYPSVMAHVHKSNASLACSSPLGGTDYLRTSGQSAVCHGSTVANESTVYLAFYGITPTTSVILNCSRNVGDNLDWNNMYLWRFYSQTLPAEGGLTWNTQPLECSMDYGECIGGYGGITPTIIGDTRIWDLTSTGVYGGENESDFLNIKLAFVAWNPARNKVAYFNDGLTTAGNTCKLQLSGSLLNATNLTVHTLVNGAPTDGVIVNVYYFPAGLPIIYLSKTSNDTGLVRMTVAPGTYMITAGYSGFYASTIEAFSTLTAEITLNIDCLTCPGGLDAAELSGTVFFNGVPVGNATVTLINGSDHKRYGYTDASGFYSIPNLRTCEYNGYASYGSDVGELEGISLMGDTAHNFYLEGAWFSELNITILSSNDSNPVSGASVYIYECPPEYDPVEYYTAHGLSGCTPKGGLSTNASGVAFFTEAEYTPSLLCPVGGLCYQNAPRLLIIVSKASYGPQSVNSAILSPGLNNLLFFLGGGGAYPITYNVSDYYGVPITGASVDTEALVNGFKITKAGVTAAGLLTLQYSSKPSSLNVVIKKTGFDDFFYHTSFLKQFYSFVLTSGPAEYNETGTVNISGNVTLNGGGLRDIDIIADCMTLGGYFTPFQWVETTDASGHYLFSNVPASTCDIHPAFSSAYSFTPDSYINFDATANNDTLDFAASHEVRGYDVSFFIYNAPTIIKNPLAEVEVVMKSLTNLSFHINSDTSDSDGKVYYELPSGCYNTTFSKSGFIEKSMSFCITPSSVHDFEIGLSSGASYGTAVVSIFRMSGSVSSEESGVIVLKDASGSVIFTTPLPVHSYTFTGLVPGKYAAGVVGVHGGSAAVSFSVKAGETTRVSLSIDDVVSRLDDAWNDFVEILLAMAGGMGLLLFLLFFAAVMTLARVITKK